MAPASVFGAAPSHNNVLRLVPTISQCMKPRSAFQAGHDVRILIPEQEIRPVRPRRSTKGVRCALPTRGVKSWAPKGLPFGTMSAGNATGTFQRQLGQEN